MVDYSGDLVVKKIETYKLSSNGQFLEDYELSHVWSLGKQGSGAYCQLRFQRNGNLCLYEKNGSLIWSAESVGGVKLLILDDTGSLRIYDQQETLIWNMRKSKPATQKFQLLSSQERPLGTLKETCTFIFSSEKTPPDKAILITDKNFQKVLLNISGVHQNFIWNDTPNYTFENLNYTTFLYTGKYYDLEIRMLKNQAKLSTGKKLYLILKTKNQIILKTKRLIGYRTC